MGALSLVLKFLFAPVLSAGICFVIGIRGALFRDAVIQVLNLNPHILFCKYLYPSLLHVFNNQNVLNVVKKLRFGLNLKNYRVDSKSTSK